MPSISEVIKDDHHCLIALRQQVLTSKDKDAMTKKFLQELYQHLDVETHMLDPLLPKTLPGREQRIERVGRMREKRDALYGAETHSNLRTPSSVTLLTCRLYSSQLHVLRGRIVDESWNKPAFILSILLSEMSKSEDERLEWLFWVDRDVIILNACRSPNSFLPPQLQTEGEDGKMQEMAAEPGHIQLLVTQDWNGLNNGVFFLRVGRWVVDLLSAILSYRYYKPDVDLPFTEQSARAYF
ncbi:hypothetical protein S7711_06672 [Stachybotrys chartarum IBT 7711]|uniref:Uncharacterized protein n=1 Tax=Stachybotrys chartarum (strain CBS 109288 / IBT 7711) TaxID=1280523 RepID=A0A084BB45_STACB|nr:hypothetical protein S7711_06672 [Stachybotrys chartarum IBT 7711]